MLNTVGMRFVGGKINLANKMYPFPPCLTDTTRVKTQFICLPNSIRPKYGPWGCERAWLSNWATTNQTQTDPPRLETKPLAVPSESRHLNNSKQSPNAPLTSKLQPRKAPRSQLIWWPQHFISFMRGFLSSAPLEFAPRDTDKVTLTCLASPNVSRQADP